MKLSYKKLWVKLVEQDLKKTEFAKKQVLVQHRSPSLAKGQILLRTCF